MDAHKGLPYYTSTRVAHVVYSREAPCGRPSILLAFACLFCFILSLGFYTAGKRIQKMEPSQECRCFQSRFFLPLLRAQDDGEDLASSRRLLPELC